MLCVFHNLANERFSNAAVKQKLTFKGRDSGFWHDISNGHLKCYEE